MSSCLVPVRLSHMAPITSQFAWIADPWQETRARDAGNTVYDSKAGGSRIPLNSSTITILHLDYCHSPLPRCGHLHTLTCHIMGTDLTTCLDAHAHLLEYGFKMQLRLDEVSSLSELLDIVEAYAKKHSSASDTWIEALGWDQTRWNDTDGSFPTAVSTLVFLTIRPLVQPVPDRSCVPTFTCVSPDSAASCRLSRSMVVSPCSGTYQGTSRRNVSPLRSRR